MSDERYVHDPDGTMATESDADSPTDEKDADLAADEREFDWRGWALVGLVVVCFLVIPGIIWLNPPALPFQVAYLVLPLVPAFVLGLVAVWVTATK